MATFLRGGSYDDDVFGTAIVFKLDEEGGEIGLTKEETDITLLSFAENSEYGRIKKLIDEKTSTNK